jgi:NitT/TauT family transport system ATP-binding protein
LLDEPFGALDPGITADMHKLILELWSQTAMTVFMITHDIKEGFHLGTRLLVFDKVRHDPQAPEANGARITYDIPLKRRSGIVRPSVPLAGWRTDRGWTWERSTR